MAFTSAPETFDPAKPHLCKDGRRRSKLRVHIAGLAVLARRTAVLPLNDAELDQVIVDVQCPKCGTVTLVRWRDLLGMN